MPVAAVPLLLTALSTVAQVVSTMDAASDARKQRRTDQRIADIKASRERRRLEAEARQAQARIAVQSQAQNIQGSSAQAGASGSVQSQLAGEVGFLNTTRQLSKRSANLSTSIANKQLVSNIAGTAAQFSYQMFQDKGGFDALFSNKE